MTVRTSVKAIIIRNDKLLVTANRDDLGEFYLLPGGGQLHGENLHEALRRECMEEIGTEIFIGELRLVRDYIGKNHEFAGSDGNAHQVEFMFECDVPCDYFPENGTVPDSMQTGVKWIPVKELHMYRLYPSRLFMAIEQMKNGKMITYMGDVN